MWKYIPKFPDTDLDGKIWSNADIKRQGNILYSNIAAYWYK